jgi:gliding motility-associated-like protein
MFKKLSYCFVLLIFAFKGNTTTITVTTNLDAGSGSLRNALRVAANNGTTIRDTIRFNMNPLNRRITIDSLLPDVSSNLVIDATTQLGSPIFANGDAKVVIQCGNYTNCKIGLRLYNVDDIEIYGLGIIGFIPQNTMLLNNDFGDGIIMYNCNNITIGKPFGGNVISANYYGIRNVNTVKLGSTTEKKFCSNNIIIKGNILGKLQLTSNLVYANAYSVSLTSANNVTIGGDDDEDGNSFLYYINGVEIVNGTDDLKNSFYNIVSKNNFQRGLLPGNLSSITFGGSAIGLSHKMLNDSLLISKNKFLVAKNLFKPYVESAITVSGFGRQSYIIGNVANEPTNTCNAGVLLNACDSVKIGGQNDSANIFRALNYGVISTQARYVQITRNSIFCSFSGIQISLPKVQVPTVFLSGIQLNGIYGGKTLPFATIEVFNTNDCQDKIYNGQIFTDTVIADATGNWLYKGPVNCNTSFTSTSTLGVTSGFYTPYNFIIDTTSLQVLPSTCSKANGTIKGLKVFEGVSFGWYNIKDSLISTDTVLVAAAGVYYLRATLTSLGCTLYTRRFVIIDINPALDESDLVIKNSVDCKPTSGSITGLRFVNSNAGPYALYTWKNANGVIVGTQLSLVNQPAGVYNLTVKLTIDTNCTAQVGPYTILQLPSPSLNLSNVEVTPDTCGNSKGSIKNIKVDNAFAPSNFLWQNGSGQIISTQINAINLPSGNYQLTYSDASGCAAIKTPFYLIHQNGKTSIDDNAVIITPSGCTVPNGSINNISSTNSNSSIWYIGSSTTIIGTQLNLANQLSGLYTLTISNSYGCSKSKTYNIPQQPFNDVTITSADERPATCQLANGYYKPVQLSKPALSYSFIWKESISNIVLSNQLNLQNVNAGSYILQATDTNGCKKDIATINIIQKGSPIINTNTITITPDTCNLSTGGISNLQIKGGTMPYTIQYVGITNPTFNSTNTSISNVKSGQYRLIVKDSFGCADTMPSIIVPPITEVLPIPVYPSNLIILKGEEVNLYNTNIYKGLGWYTLTNSLNNLLLQNSTGNFNVGKVYSNQLLQVYLQKGSCITNKAFINIKAIDSTDLTMPNAFSPNGDGINDDFGLPYKSVLKLGSFAVFNRNGAQVFYTTNDAEKFTGNYAGKSLPAGTYWWIIKAINIFGKPILKSGSVTILR